MRFEEIGINEQLMPIIKQLGFVGPTLIQEKSIPHILKGKDVIGESATGSGKTLAFSIGVNEQATSSHGLQALVLVPTRELAEQVKSELRRFSSYKRLNIICVYGGVSINPQISDLKRADVVVATPGRLLDHMQRNTIGLSMVRILVLDEVDRMLDMGFIDDVEKIIMKCPKSRQTLFFSATIPSKIRSLAERYMASPIYVSGIAMVDPAKLKQVYYDTQRSLKPALLVHLLKNERSELGMIFCNTRRATDFVVKNLRANNINALAIHGGLSQNKRSRTLSLFNGAKVNVIVCTDIAARGLHIDDVSHIYNYDIPKDPKDYVHRIGRTARAGENGKVINLLCDVDHENFSRLRHEYSFSIERMQRPYVERINISKEFFHRENNRRPFRHRSRY